MYKSPRYTPSSRLSGWGYCAGLFIFAVAATGLILGAVSLSKIHDLEPASAAASVQELTSAQLAAVQGEIDALRASQSNADGTLDKQLKTLERSMRDGQGTSKKIDEAMLGLQASQRRLGFVEEAYNRLAKAVQAMENDDSAVMIAGESTSSSSSRSSDDDDDSSSSSSSSSNSEKQKRNPLVYCETDAQCGPAPACRTVQCVSEFWSKLGMGSGPHCSIGLAPVETLCQTDDDRSGSCDASGTCIPFEGRSRWWRDEDFANYLLRDDYDNNQIISELQRGVAAYFGPAVTRNLTYITVPEIDWTGFTPVDAAANLPRRLVAIDELSDTGIAELVLSIGLLVEMENSPIAHIFALSTDLKGHTLPHTNNAEIASHYTAMATIANTVYNLLADPARASDVEDTQFLSLKIMNGWFRTLATLTEDPDYNFEMSFEQVYSFLHKRGYNYAMSYDCLLGFVYNFFFAGNLQFINRFNPEFFGLAKDSVRALPFMIANNARGFQRIVEDERNGVGKYFYNKIIMNPNEASVFGKDVDAEGYHRLPDVTAETFTGQGLNFPYDVFFSPEALGKFESASSASIAAAGAGTRQEVHELTFVDFHSRKQNDQAPIYRDSRQLSRRKRQIDEKQNIGLDSPFRELNNEFSGFPFTYEDVLSEIDGSVLNYGFKSIVETYLDADEAAQVLDACAEIWDNEILPALHEYQDIIVDRAAEAFDDDYPGIWRAGIALVVNVTRGPDDKAIDFTTELDGEQIKVPFDANENAAYAASHVGTLDQTDLIDAYVGHQRSIADMSKWYNDQLGRSLDIRNGDTFLVLKKSNPGKGIIQGSPYASVSEIITNFASVDVIVSDQNPLDEVVYASGLAGDLLFFDLKEFLGNEWVKENPGRFGFISNPGDAGLYEVNDNGTEISLADAINDAVVVAGETKSDLDVLGRHYGFNVDGTVNGTEQSGGGDLVYTYELFDYIYRQHYAVDSTAPLTPANRFDPVTGKEFYQYTDLGDEDRRDAFIDEFSQLEALQDNAIASLVESENKAGTYFRWKNDWQFQHITEYVIENSVQLGIVRQSFIDEFFTFTFINTLKSSSSSGNETLMFRLLGQLGGSANSGSIIDINKKRMTVRYRLTTLNPRTTNTVASDLGTALHEGALGHGFDQVPNIMKLFRGNPSDLSWLSNVNSNFGIFTEGEFLTYPVLGPGYATIVEGWATFGELVGLELDLYIKFSDDGEILDPTVNGINAAAAINSLVGLSRITARQTTDVGYNSPKYAWSFFRGTQQFTETTNLPIASIPDFHVRFWASPTQQTTYASGFITNLGIANAVKAEITSSLPGCTFSLAKFVEFRILRTDFFLGSALVENALSQIETFADCP